MVKKYNKKRDPYYEREKKKYSDPLPSREFIIEFLEELNTPCSPKKMLSGLGLKKSQFEALSRRLAAMERDGQLRCNRKGCYGLLNKLELVTGKIDAHRDGFGFLMPEDGSRDIFIPIRQMRGLFAGDRVVVRVMKTNTRGRREGAVVEVLSHDIHQVVGKLCCEGGIWFVSPDSKSIPHDIMIAPDDIGDAKSGQFVGVELQHELHPHQPVRGKVVEVLGDHLTIGMEIELALRSHQIPHNWSGAVLNEVNQIDESISDDLVANRRDLRDLPLVTIDGEDAKDFDDAVYCNLNDEGNWRVIVAIADVAHYVLPNSAIDQEAVDRGNSVYFPARVIPMLPEALSNGVCSLNPHVDRLALAAEITLSAGGKILHAEFYNAVIHSHARLTYEQVNAFLKKQQELPSEVSDNVSACYQVFQLLLKQRQMRGAIDFDTIETRIVFDDAGKIDKIIPVVRNEAHRLIEELMLLANKAAAEYLLTVEMPVLYRNHDTPDDSKLQALRDFIKLFGLKLGGGEEPVTLDFAKLLSAIHQRKDSHLLQTVLLRSLKQAKFEPDCRGHFGLAYDAYCQFTSPIRRYPDLIIHRAIKASIVKSKADYPYKGDDMPTLGDHFSVTERRADKAVRDSVDWLKCFYMQDKVGQTFDGIISDVTSFGLFVQLDNIYVEGLVHISTLQNDYYHYDETHHVLRGKNGGQSYRLGDRIRVLVAQVNIDTRRIDFDCLTSEK